MRILPDIKLDFSDILLVPKRSTIESRKEINLERVFHFRYSTMPWAGIPIISSNMTSVTTPKVAEKMLEHHMLACQPKNVRFPFSSDDLIPSVGLNSDYGDFEYGFLCVDVPNGYIENIVSLTKAIRDLHQERVTLIVGNVVTAEQTEALILAGADIIKIGIGGGSACSTRIKTGVGMPQLSAVIECADAAHGLNGLIISDGGCQVTGDVCKAFAAGADFVMLGGMLAGHEENAKICITCEGTGSISTLDLVHSIKCTYCDGLGKNYDFYGSSSERSNNETAGGLKNYRASEGWEIKLPNRGSIENTLQDIEGGLRSACAYVGAKNLKSLSKCATFVQVNRQANISLLDYRI